MDEIDLKICLTLLENSRMVFRRLADEVELSVNAVYNRVQNLIDTGIISGFHAHIGMSTLPGSFLMIMHGPSKFDDLSDVVSHLSEDEYSFKLVSTSDNYLYIYGILPSLFEMDDYVENIHDIAGMDHTEVFIPSIKKVSPQKKFDFTKTDYRIIHSLREDCRKSLSKIADELGVSTKTIKRRINMMDKAGVIDYSIKWYPVYSDDFIGYLHTEIKNKERDKLLYDIKKNNFPNIFETEKSSNHPQKVLIKLWSPNLKIMHDLMEEFRGSEHFGPIKNRMLYDIEYFKTWRDDLLEEKVKG